MKTLGGILIALVLSANAFAQNVSEEKIEAVRAVIAEGISEDAADYFASTQHDYTGLIHSVGNLQYIKTTVIKSVVKAIQDNEKIEETSSNYFKKNPEATHQQLNEALLSRAVTPLRNYSADTADSLLTFIELYYRHSTENDQFVSQRTHGFLIDVRKALTLPEFNRGVCVKANAPEYCPVAKAEAPKPYRQPSSLRLEKR
jgi:hypothetical protein